MFALEHSPTFPLDIESLTIPAYVPEDRFSMTVVGTFADLGKLIGASQELQGILARCAAWYESEPLAKALLLDADVNVEVPLEPPIVDWLTTRNLAIPPTGIGWLGKESEAKDAVVRIGSSLCVHRLKPCYNKLSNGKDFYYDAEYDVHHPLVIFFEEFGGEVLGEGDCNGHDGIVADLTCSCSDLVGNHLERELWQYNCLDYNLYALPPWHPKGISPDHVRARETFNRLSNGGETEHPDDDPIVARKLKQRSSFASAGAWGIDIGFHVGQLHWSLD